jgi:hypothetical protein
MITKHPPPPSANGSGGSGAAEVLIGKSNYFALLVGPPEHGKSSLAAQLALERLEAGRWLLAQDQNAEFGRLCVRYPTTDAFLGELAAAAEDGRRVPAGAAFPCVDGADDVLRLGVTLGEQWNRAHGFTREPICVVINEASGFESTGSTYLDRLQNVVLNQRRHLGLELIYCLTRPSMLPRPVYDVATDVFLFFQPSSDRIRALEGLLGLERGELEPLLELPPHRYLHWTPRRGDGRGGLV